MHHKLSLLLLTGLAAATFSNPAAAQQWTLTIYGTVLDSVTMDPVPEVAVYVDGTTEASRTDDFGSFEVPDLDVGEHALVLLKDGYSPRLFSFNASENHRDAVDVGLVLLSRGPSPTARVSGTVKDAVTGLPVFGIDVRINGALVAVTDLRGRFDARATEVSWGTNHVGFHRIGYTPVNMELWTAQDWTEFGLAIDLEPLALVMPQVVVEGERTTYYYNRNIDFERRRRGAAGTFITRRDIEERRPRVVSELLERVPGVSVAPTMRGANIVQMKFGRFGKCPPDVYMDGMRIPAVPVEYHPEAGTSTYEHVFIDRLVEADNVVGIEVYNGPAGIPTEFLSVGSDCGVIAIWTR